VAANNIGLTYTEIKRQVGTAVGVDPDPTAWDSDTSTKMADAIEAGLRQFYWPPNGHVWSFLSPTQAQLEVHGAYETGTVAVTLGVVTLTTGTFPSWAAQGDLWVDGGYYPVSTRDSSTQVTLVDTTLTGLSGETYSLKHREYDLPDDFGGLLEPFTYRQDQSVWKELKRVNESMIRSMEQYPETNYPPEYFCITSVVPSATQESKARAIFAPLPEAGATYYLWYRYTVVPPLLDGSTYVYPHGGAEFANVVRLSCLDQASQFIYKDMQWHGPFLEALNSASTLDLRKNKPKSHGFASYSDGYMTHDYRSRRESLADFTYDTSNL
jgi:hypothetical protein